MLFDLEAREEALGIKQSIYHTPIHRGLWTGGNREKNGSVKVYTEEEVQRYEVHNRKNVPVRR